MMEIEREIGVIVSNILEIDESELWEHRDKNLFEVLELDSLLALEIVASLERKYKIEIYEDTLEEITTLDKIIEITNQLLNTRSEVQRNN